MFLASQRFSIRQMAIAIAVLAVFSAMIAELADSYKQFHHAYWAPIVERHAEEARLYSETAASQPPDSTEKNRSLLRIAAHRDLQRSYQDVLDNPWRPVPSNLIGKLPIRRPKSDDLWGAAPRVGGSRWRNSARVDLREGTNESSTDRK